MELDEKQASCSDPLLLCCVCKNALQEPMQLQCLHSCCRRCLSIASDADKSNTVTCPSCNRATKACDAEPNTFLDYLLRGCLAMAEVKVCTICKENGEAHEMAVEWCGTCRHSLCGDCIPAHRRYNRNHCTEVIDEMTSLEDMHTKLPLRPCSIHHRPLEVVCFTCEKAKCLNCWEACNKSKHVMGLMTEVSFEVCLQNLKSVLSSAEAKLVSSSEVFKKCMMLPNELKSSRKDHLEQIQQRKRIIIDAIEKVYQEIEHSTKIMYDEVDYKADNAVAIAARLEGNLNFSLDYARRLVGSNNRCDLWIQHKMIRSHLISLSTELDHLASSMSEFKKVVIQPSLPENLDYVLRSWIGEPRVCTAQLSSQKRPQLLCAPSDCMQLPQKCCDVTLTQDGRVLLAAEVHGLLEFCSKGHKLSQWQPPKSNHNTDKVYAVCALSDGRVAVGLFYAQQIVLLNGIIALDGQSKTSWIEDRRLDKLQSPPRFMAVYKDALAVAEWSFDKQQQNWRGGPQLELMRLSSGKQVTAMTFEYVIGGTALTAQAIITSSSGKVALGSNRTGFVIDAHNIKKERLWRYELANDDEVIKGIFSFAASRLLYVAFHKINGSSGGVAAISSEDGSEQRHHVLSFDGRLLPVRLSLDDSGTVIAALCTETESKEQRTVTLHMIALI